MTDTHAHDESPSEFAGETGSGLLTDADGRSVPYQTHPLADLFPMIGGAEFAALVDDVRANGVRRPIVLFEGKVLDGRNRYMAAREVGCGYPVVDFTGDDPVAFVISENLRRRHMTESQRAMVAKRLETTSHGDFRRTLSQDANLHLGRPTTDRAAAAEALNVSPRSVATAAKVLDSGTPALIAAVDAGEVSVSAAAEVAKLPESEQAEIVAQGAQAVRDTARAARQKAEPVARQSTGPVSNLTPGALSEENEALKSDLETVNARLAKVTAERDALKAQVADLSAQNQGPVISKLQAQVAGLKYKLGNAEDAAKRAEFKEKKALARVKELEDTPVEVVS